MQIRKGLNGGQYKPLSDEDIGRIHETSLRVFAEVGVQMNSATARELFGAAGAQVNDASRVVKVPQGLVE